MKPVATWTLDILQTLETTTTTTVGIDEKIRDTTIEIVNHGKDLVRDQDMEVAIGEIAANISDQKLIAWSEKITIRTISNQSFLNGEIPHAMMACLPPSGFVGTANAQPHPRALKPELNDKFVKSP